MSNNFIPYLESLATAQRIVIQLADIFEPVELFRDFQRL